ncbi:MAG: cytochrome b [Alphaproteobacteria bacterium]|nr:cytochrome b [Alphaproteobacteria bacterium]
MENTGSTEKYPYALRALHWLMAAIILGLTAVGWYMAELPKEDPSKFMFYGWHKSFGVLALLLIALRIAVRVRASVPPLPEALGAMVNRLSHAGHKLLYLLMVLVPLSGYVMSVSGGHEVRMFGILIPALLPKSEFLGGIAHELHELLPYLLLAVVIAHVAGVVWHRAVDKQNLLPRMSLKK